MHVLLIMICDKNKQNSEICNAPQIQLLLLLSVSVWITHKPYLIYLAHRDDKLVHDLRFTFDFLHYYQRIPQILSSLSTGVLTR